MTGATSRPRDDALTHPPASRRPKELIIPIVDPATASAHRLYPSVSLLVPLAGETPWPARLRRLRDEAEERLRHELGRGLDEHLVARLTAAVEDAEPPPSARSLAVYVNADVTSIVGLGVESRERVVIDDTFATRDIVADDLRQPRYWVLALNLADPQLLKAHGGRLRRAPLPVADVAPPPSTGRKSRGRDRRAVTDAQNTRRLRAVDVAVATAVAGDDDPLVVVGVEPTLSRFLTHTRHVARIEGVLRRAPDANPQALARTVTPAVAEMLAERRIKALDTLERAVGQGTSASGLEPVWRLAHRRTPGLLLVEAGYAQPARVLDGGRLEPVEDPTIPGVTDDAVDEVIEAVLAVGGRIELVPDGVLATHQRIAFVPWQARRKR